MRYKCAGIYINIYIYLESRKLCERTVSLCSLFRSGTVPLWRSPQSFMGTMEAGSSIGRLRWPQKWYVIIIIFVIVIS